MFEHIEEESQDRRVEQQIKRSRRIARTMRILNLCVSVPLMLVGLSFNQWFLVYFGLFLLINFSLVRYIHRSNLKDYE